MFQKSPPQIALIGSTASGKSSLALELAQEHHALILSLDSLALYRDIDIASAKPSPEELAHVPHYGIDILWPDEPFDVTRFVKLYRKVRLLSIRQGHPLIIVGGSSFYLKVLLEGVSPFPTLSEEQRHQVQTLLRDPKSAHNLLHEQDPHFAQSISASDRYRIEKGLQILIATGEPPSHYFQTHPPQTVIEEDVALFEISREREELRKRIRLRTEQMLTQGLIDEVAMLEYRYGRSPNPMKAIGIREVLDYFDGRYGFEEMREKIVTNTARLAKRQETFNRSQFQQLVRGDEETLRDEIGKYLSQNLH